MSAAIEYITIGRLPAPAVTMATRSEALTNVPRVGEFVPGFEPNQVYGIGAPREYACWAHPEAENANERCLRHPTVKARLAIWGKTPLGGSSAEFAKLAAEETEKCAACSDSPARRRTERFSQNT
jgi:hypothetical protein